MIHLKKCTKESRPRDKKRKRYMLILPISLPIKASGKHVYFHLTEKEVTGFKKVLK